MKKTFAIVFTALAIITGCQNPSDVSDLTSPKTAVPIIKTEIVKDGIYNFYWNNEWSINPIDQEPEGYPEHEYKVYKDKISGDIIVETTINPDGRGIIGFAVSIDQSRFPCIYQYDLRSHLEDQYKDTLVYIRIPKEQLKTVNSFLFGVTSSNLDGYNICLYGFETMDGNPDFSRIPEDSITEGAWETIIPEWSGYY